MTTGVGSSIVSTVSMLDGFDHQHLGQFALAAFLLVLSICDFVSGRTRRSVMTLTAAMFVLRWAMASLDPFLHDWDERFHALVARNLISHPLKPTLYESPFLHYDYTDWTSNHIWLNKPPLALWQMALSLRLFGINEFSVRIPSIVMGTLLIPVLYRIGRITIHEQAGYLAALIFAVSYYQLRFASGAEPVDQIDNAFIFYVTASLWSWLEYRRSGHWGWALTVGVLAGFAVLTKWLVGLVVFAGWGLALLTNHEDRMRLQAWTPLLAAMVVALLIFLPWQVYIFRAFPQEAVYAFSNNGRHFTEVIEGHEAPWYWYYNRLHVYYSLPSWLVALCLAVLMLRLRSRAHRVFLFTVFLSCQVIFSVAATKMPAYGYVVTAIPTLAVAATLQVILRGVQMQLPRWHRLIAAMALTLCCVLLSRYWAIESNFARSAPRRVRPVALARFYRELNTQLADNVVVFNQPFDDHASLMFYTGNTGYSTLPAEAEFVELRRRKIPIAFIQSPWGEEMPEYMKNTPDVQVVPLSLQVSELRPRRDGSATR